VSTVNVTLPKLGVEMETAVLAEWLVAPGDEVAAGDVVANLETEKVVFELEAPAAGLLHPVAETGEEYAIGDLLAVLAATREAYDALAAGGAPPAAPAAPAPTEAATNGAAPPAAAAPANGAAPVPLSGRDEVAAARQGGTVLASPVARRMAAAHGIDLQAVAGSGPRGAIRRRDVEAARTAAPAAPAPAPAAAPAAPAAPAVAANGETVVPVSTMRRTIAQRMHASMQTTAQMTDVREYDVTDLVAFRTAAVSRADALGFKLGYTAIFAKAAVMALRAVPELNASLRSETELVRYDHVNLGMAVAIPDGLLVPVVREADRLGLRELNQTLNDVVERARTRTATAEEMSGGTFTITNFGSFGSHFGTPILLPPQVAILGVGAMLDRPVVRDGALAVGKAMYLSLTVDHRVIDGETAGRFHNEVGRLLAEPDLLLYG
jgi:pyruvate dehydrogenase E2 component (dihydrolipoamide acetyltransferase)